MSLTTRFLPAMLASSVILATALPAFAVGTDLTDQYNFMNRDKRVMTDAMKGGKMDMDAGRRASCAALYPSYDPKTNTFRGQDGLIHRCQ